jgi:ketosteroid isomerase-like protein
LQVAGARYCGTVSKQDVEIVRDSLDAFNRGDWDRWFTMFHEDTELYSLRAQLEGHPYRGPEGMRRFVADLHEQWDYVRLEAPEIRDAGEWIVILGDFKARGSASGVEVDFRVGVVFATREGKITYGRFYSDSAEALDAAGLSE